jgi:hypothetical protein
VVALLLPSSTPGQDCSCTNSFCSRQGFQIALVGYTLDQDAGTSSWEYTVCNDRNFEGQCVPPKDLSHVDISLPGLGGAGGCLNAGQTMGLEQVAGFSDALLSCGVSEKDPSCDISGTSGTDFVAKCDVVGDGDEDKTEDIDNLDPGECVQIKLTIAGEKPTLGPGGVDVVTKAGRDCQTDAICGPACDCTPPPPQGCLTRTRGFWGTHPAITEDYLSISVCGRTLDTVTAGSCSSVTEAVCSNSSEAGKNNQAYVSLVAQLAAAKLNLAATAANEGDCGSAIAARIAECERLCSEKQSTISGSGCIEDLTAFNRSQDTFGTTLPPFDRPGPADSSQCQQANGNKIVIGKGSCSGS